MKRKITAVLAATALVFGLVGVAAQPAGAWTECRGAAPQRPYAAYPFGIRVIVGETTCLGYGNLSFPTTCVEERIEPWGAGNGFVWVNPDGTCSGDLWDAAPSDCGHYFRTTADGIPMLGSQYWFWDAC